MAPEEEPRIGPRAAAPASVLELVNLAARRFAAAEVDSPRLSAELLAGRAFGLTRLGLIMEAKSLPDGRQCAALAALVRRRERGEPVAYLLGEREFFGLGFHVTSDVLIPRPETECIVEEAERLFAVGLPLLFADFGSGSGCLAVTLAHEFPQSGGVALDLSAAALAVARGNARRHGVEGRLTFVRADFTRTPLRPAGLDLIVANPPYVSEAEYGGLSREVRDYEPRLALVSPEDGLGHLRGLLPEAARALKPGGRLLCEIGAGQGRAALSLAGDSALGFAAATLLRDYAGLDRVLSAVRAA